MSDFVLRRSASRTRQRAHAARENHVLEVLEVRQLLSAAPRLINEVEPNTTLATAQQIVLSDRVKIEVVGASMSPTDVDYYKFTPKTDALLSLQIPAGNTIPTRVEVDDANGNVLLVTDPAHNKNFGTVAVSAGMTYSIIVQNSAATSPTTYLVDLSLTNGGIPHEVQEALSKGVGVTSWFAFLNGKEPASHFTTGVTDAELNTMASLGLKHVRLAVEPGFLFNPSDPTHFDATHLGYLDQAIQRINQHGLAVVLDLHANGTSTWETDPVKAQSYVVFVNALAQHYSYTRPTQLAFEPLNEPLYHGKLNQWVAYQNQLIEAVRSAAPHHTILAVANDFSSITALQTLPIVAHDNNIMYSFQFYNPWIFTAEGTPPGYYNNGSGSGGSGSGGSGGTYGNPNPGLTRLHDLPYPLDNTRIAALLQQYSTDAQVQALIKRYQAENWNADKINAMVKAVADWAASNHVHLYAEEFGVYTKNVQPADRDRYLTDLRKAFEQYHIGWAVWGWNGPNAFGLDARVDAQGKVTYDVQAAIALGLNVNGNSDDGGGDEDHHHHCHHDGHDFREILRLLEKILTAFLQQLGQGGGWDSSVASHSDGSGDSSSWSSGSSGGSSNSDHWGTDSVFQQLGCNPGFSLCG